MQYKDYYKILGVSRNATTEEIKKAYRAKVRLYHPDLNPDNKDADEKIKEVNEAFEVLGDSDKKRAYDQMDPAGSFFGGQTNRGYSEGYRSGYSYQDKSSYNSDNDNEHFGDGGFSDFFKSFFSSQSSQKTDRNKVNLSLVISLEDAYKGGEKRFMYQNREYKISIRPGVKSGSIVRLSNVVVGESGIRMDINVEIKVSPHKIFEWIDDDLYCEATVDLYTAVLGGEVFVQTLDNKVKVNIPAGTQNGHSLRLRAKGMPTNSNALKFGNLFLKIKVAIPAKLSSEETLLFQQLRELSDKKNK